jgi:hypothetical protein
MNLYDDFKNKIIINELYELNLFKNIFCLAHKRENFDLLKIQKEDFYTS